MLILRQRHSGLAMNQHTYDDVQEMTYQQLGEINDAMQLMSTGHVSPILVRYVVRTDPQSRTTSPNRRRRHREHGHGIPCG